MAEVRDPAAVAADTNRLVAPDPALVRTVVVQILKDHEAGLTAAELQSELLERLHAHFQPRVQVDLENLRTLGIVAESPSDERKYVVTRLADVFLRGAETLSHG